jgi:hypothetical protein
MYLYFVVSDDEGKPISQDSIEDPKPVDPDPGDDLVDLMVTKESMSEIISNEEVYLAQEQEEQVQIYHYFL